MTAAVTATGLPSLRTPMGRPIPQAVRDDLKAVATCKPLTDEMRQDWRGIRVRVRPTALTAGWIDTFVPPGHPNPFADHWLPESTDWYLEKLLAGGRAPDGRS